MGDGRGPPGGKLSGPDSILAGRRRRHRDGAFEFDGLSRRRVVSGQGHPGRFLTALRDVFAQFAEQRTHSVADLAHRDGRANAAQRYSWVRRNSIVSCVVIVYFEPS